MPSRTARFPSFNASDGQPRPVVVALSTLARCAAEAHVSAAGEAPLQQVGLDRAQVALHGGNPRCDRVDRLAAAELVDPRAADGVPAPQHALPLFDQLAAGPTVGLGRMELEPGGRPDLGRQKRHQRLAADDVARGRG